MATIDSNESFCDLLHKLCVEQFPLLHCKALLQSKGLWLDL